MAETKEGYIELQNMIDSMVNERDKPRCINCEHNLSKKCNIFKVDIPDDQEYRRTECGQWMYGIPF